MPESKRFRPRRSHARRLVVGSAAVVVVLAAGTTAWAVTTGSGTSYRTAIVTRGSVRQVLTTTGTLRAMHAASVDFQVAGTVKRIDAHQGARVSAGATLATLDRTTLAATLAAARSTLTDARSTLAENESGESSTTQRTSTVRDTSTETATDTAMVLTAASAAPSPHPTTTRDSGGRSTSAIAKDQAAVVAAQHTTDTALAAAKATLAATKEACATPGSSACAADAAELLADQTTVSTNENAVLTAEKTLDTDSEKLASSGSATTSTPSPSPSASGSRGSSSSGSHTSGTSGTSSSRTGGSTSGATTTVTAATLASDEALIDADRATVATDRADLAEATLTSPISGHVTAVTISKGEAVSGSSSSSSPAFVVTGSGHDAVTLSLTATQVRTVATGMTATARADGSDAAVRGHVVRIGAENSDSDYPVTVELAGTSSRLVSGADAAVTVVLATAHDAITVPTSAIHRSGSTTYVEVPNGDKEARHTVVVGATGAAVTQIRSGLSPGQRVILANINAAVPSSSSDQTTTRQGRSGLGGGFGTGGMPGGGVGGRLPSDGFPGGGSGSP